MFSTRYPDLALHLHTSPYTPIVRNNAAWEPPSSLGSVEILYVYGLGPYPTIVKEWLANDQRRRLVFLEDNLAAFAAFSEQEIVDHPQIHLKWIEAPHLWDLVLEQFAALFSTDKIEVVACKAYEKLPRFRKIKLSLLRKSLLWYSVTAENLVGHLLHQNIIPNLRRLPRCSYVNDWKDQLKGVPAIICGAGPSLKGVAPALKGARALIIGCGSALSALAHLGIRPDLGMAIDPNAKEFDCLKGCIYRDLPLLFGARLYPKVFELFDGPFGYIRSGSSSKLENYVEEQLGRTDPSLGNDLGREALSVTTLAISLAHHWGCNPIILAGVDLAYAKQQHYVEGVPVSPALEEKRAGEHRLRRKNKAGEWVATMTKWVMEQETINDYAKAHPETVFLNTSGGLRFKDIPDVQLEKIDLPAYTARVGDLMAKTKMNVTSAQIEAVLQPLGKSLEKCLELTLLLEQAEGGKAVLYEIELEEEPAYRLLLEAPRRDYERLQTSASDEKWKLLTEAARTYLSLIRK